MNISVDVIGFICSLWQHVQCTFLKIILCLLLMSGIDDSVIGCRYQCNRYSCQPSDASANRVSRFLKAVSLTSELLYNVYLNNCNCLLSINCCFCLCLIRNNGWTTNQQMDRQRQIGRDRQTTETDVQR